MPEQSFETPNSNFSLENALRQPVDTEKLKTVKEEFKLSKIDNQGNVKVIKSSSFKTYNDALTALEEHAKKLTGEVFQVQKVFVVN